MDDKTKAIVDAALEAGDYLAEFFEEGREHPVLVRLDAALAAFGVE